MNTERFLGINIEYKKTNKLALAGLVIISEIYKQATGFTVEGQFPPEGPAIIVSNHTSSTDIFRGCIACIETAHRVIRGVARESLLDPSIEDPKDVLEETGKTGAFKLMKSPLVTQTIAFVLNGIGTIPIQRGKKRDRIKDRKFLLTCDEVLNSGQLLGIFIQQTRVKEGDLRNPFEGAGVLARRHRDVLIIPVSILARHFGNNMIIGESTTYNQLVQKTGHKLAPIEVAALIGDRIAENLPPSIKERWAREDRPRFLSRN